MHARKEDLLGDLGALKIGAEENGSEWLRKELNGMDLVALRALAGAAHLQSFVRESGLQKKLIVEKLVQDLSPKAGPIVSSKVVLFIFVSYSIVCTRRLAGCGVGCFQQYEAWCGG